MCNKHPEQTCGCCQDNIICNEPQVVARRGPDLSHLSGAAAHLDARPAMSIVVEATPTVITPDKIVAIPTGYRVRA